jgi:hypothetical protein
MPDAIEYLLWRHTLDDGEQTTLYAVRHPIGATRVRVVHFAGADRLDVWCAANGHAEAIVGGFFVREPIGRSARCGSAAARPTTSRWPSPTGSAGPA